MIRFWVSTLFILLITVVASASVFSGQGIGIPLMNAMGAAPGRAGLGLAAYDSTGINVDQPASAAEFKDVHVSFTGITQNRTLSDHYGNTESQGEFQFGGFAISFPLYNHWRSGLVVEPYALTNFKTVSAETLEANPYTLKLNGSGGLTRYGVVTSVETGQWRFGLEVGALGGSINNGWQAYFTGDSGYYDGWFTVNRQMLGVYARPGIILDLDSNRYSLSAQTPSRLTVREETRFALSDRVDGLNTRFETPWTVQGGYAHQFNYWQAGVDFKWSQWSAVHSSYFRQQPVDEIGGGVWLEHPGKNGLAMPYWTKMSWRGGLQYRVLPTLTTNGAQVKEMTTAVGITLPTTQANDFLYLSAGYTVRGDKSLNLVQENVFWTAISVSLSEKWFQRQEQTRRRK